MPLKIFSAGKEYWLSPSEEWQTQKMPAGFTDKKFSFDNNFYIGTKGLR